MSSTSSTAPYALRIRLAVSGLAIAWFLAALFLFLGIRAQHRIAETAGTSAAASAVSGSLH